MNEKKSGKIVLVSWIIVFGDIQLNYETSLTSAPHRDSQYLPSSVKLRWSSGKFSGQLEEDHHSFAGIDIQVERPGQTCISTLG